MERVKNMLYYDNNMIKPNTFRQKMLAKELVQNGGSVSKAMSKVGYSQAYIKSSKLQKTATWKQLTEKLLNDDLLVKIAKQGLRAKMENKAGKLVPDWANRHKYLETNLKIRGKLTEQIEVTGGGIVGFTMIPPKDRVKDIQGE